MQIQSASGFTGEVVLYQKNHRQAEPPQGHAIVIEPKFEDVYPHRYTVATVTEDTTLFGCAVSNIERGLTFEQAQNEIIYRQRWGVCDSDRVAQAGGRYAQDV